MNKKKYIYTPENGIEESDGYLTSGEECYIDVYGFVHSIKDDIDKIEYMSFEITDDDWYEIVGVIGEYLDSYIGDEEVASECEKLYGLVLAIAEGRQ